MRVNSVIYAEESIQENAGSTVRNHIINPIGVLPVPFTPATFTFVICISFIDLRQIEQDIYVRFKRKNESKNIVEMGPFNIPPSIPSNLPPEHAGLNINLGMRNIILESEGEYVTEVYFGSELVGAYPINVVKTLK